jgi:hypothetical protein
MEINVPLVKLVVSTHSYTGSDPQTQPGVHIHVDTTPESVLCTGEDGVAFYRFPMGVIPRDQVRRLRNLLTEFLLDFPEEEV